jgi:WD40 repeat protein
VKFINTQLDISEKDNWVNVVSFTPDGESIIAGLESGHTRIWNLSSGELEHEYLYQRISEDAVKADSTSPVKALAFSPNGRYLAIGYQNGVIHVWRRDTQKIEITCYQYDNVSSLIFTSDMHYILAARNSNIVYRWDISNITRPRSTEIRFTSAVSKLRIMPDGRFMVAAGGSSSAVLYDLANDRVIYTYNLTGGISHVSVSQENNLVLFGMSDGKIKIYPLPDLNNIANIRTLAELSTLPGHMDSITALAFAPDNNHILSTSWKNRLIVWDRETQEAVHVLEAPFKAVEKMIFSPDGSHLIVQEEGGRLLFLNAYTGRTMYTLPGILPEGDLFSANGSYIVIAEVTKNIWENGTLKIVLIETGEIVISLPGWPRDWQVGFSPDGALFVTGNMQSAMIWDISTWQKIKIHGGLNSGCGQYFTPNNDLLAVIAPKGVVFKDYGSNKKLQVYCRSRPNDGFPLVLINDDQTVIYQLNEGGLWVWNLTVNELTVSKTRKYLYGKHLLAISPDSFYIASADENVRLVKNYSSEICRLPSYAAYQYRAAISADAQRFAVGSKFGVIRILSSP